MGSRRYRCCRQGCRWRCWWRRRRRRTGRRRFPAGRPEGRWRSACSRWGARRRSGSSRCALESYPKPSPVASSCNHLLPIRTPAAAVLTGPNSLQQRQLPDRLTAGGSSAGTGAASVPAGARAPWASTSPQRRWLPDKGALGAGAGVDIPLQGRRQVAGRGFVVVACGTPTQGRQRHTTHGAGSRQRGRGWVQRRCSAPCCSHHPQPGGWPSGAEPGS